MHVRSERIARQHRMNIGTIVEAPLLKVRLVGKQRFGPMLGEIEEYFVNLLRPGDTFMFAGRLLRFLRLHETGGANAPKAATGEPMVPAYEGGRLPLTTNLADRVRGLLQNPDELGRCFPSRCRNGCGCRQAALPPARPQRSAGGDVPARRPLVPGRLLLRGPQRASDAGDAADAADGARGFRAAGLRRHRLRAGHLVGRTGRTTSRALFDQDMLGDDLEAWLAESSMLRRTFRNVAVIAGLIERHHPGRGEDPPAGDGELRPDLRRAAPAPAGPHPAARDARRCRGRADRPRRASPGCWRG